ncbi:MAG: TlpA family protein disulfide reductase [Gemmatimonadetes bacterium]|nr:TlpA family protein disulfide reductase [Gemmatimonadota bacterium]
MSGRLARLAAASAVILIAVGLGFRFGSFLRDDEVDASSAWTRSLDPDPVWLEIPAPDVEFQTAGGDVVRLGDYEGQVVLLNFWGTWCPPCLVEIPHLIEVQKALAELGGTVAGPAVGSGSGEAVLRFGRERGINYPLWLSDYDTAVGQFGAAGYPFTLLIDREGIIRRKYLGPQTARTLLRDIGALIVLEPEPVPGA